MQAQLRGKGLSIITVNLGDSPDTVARYWKESKFTLPVALKGDKVGETYKIEGVPTNYLIGSDGKILAAIEGFDEEGLRQALAKAGIK